MVNEKDYLKFLMNKVEECRNNGDLLEEKIYQKCLDTFRTMLRNKRETRANKINKKVGTDNAN